ncbi:MAG: cold shock domain-containing protein [Thermoplasmata archaeon]|nr:cold shock domain-containing protein [Thermoplasmata archaeon]
MKGTVKWYDPKKCYGFIKGEDGRDVFVHRSDIPFWTIILRKGDRIEYEVEESDKGLKAKNIKCT